MKFDDINLQIIKHLKDGRKSFKLIADELLITENTVRARVNRLIEEGVLNISGLVDPENIPGHQTAIIGVKITNMRLVEKGEEFSKLNGVISVAVVTGRYDLIVQVMLNEEFSLLEFYTNEVTKIDDVQDVETFIVYKGYNYQHPLYSLNWRGIMADLTTKYMGIELKSPVIAASSGLTATVDKVKELEQAGAGAVVLKSLFEEQILYDSNKMTSGYNSEVHADALDFFNGMSSSYFLDEYLTLVEDCKKAVDIPVIASVNCITDGAWLKYAKRFENVGADALEINAFSIPVNKKLTSENYEKQYFDLAEGIKKAVNIPVALKLSPHFTSLARVLENFADLGINGLVLFNRFYRPDIDINKLKMAHAPILSSAEEMSLSLQWIALLSGEIDIDFAASTGVHDSEGVIKQLLAGAKSVQICSTLYKNGVSVIKTINDEIGSWMDSKSYSSIGEFNGMLCQEASDNPEAYERTQYMKAAVGIS